MFFPETPMTPEYVRELAAQKLRTQEGTIQVLGLINNFLKDRARESPQVFGIGIADVISDTITRAAELLQKHEDQEKAKLLEAEELGKIMARSYLEEITRITDEKKRDALSSQVEKKEGSDEVTGRGQ